VTRLHVALGGLNPAVVSVMIEDTNATVTFMLELSAVSVVELVTHRELTMRMSPHSLVECIPADRVRRPNHLTACIKADPHLSNGSVHIRIPEHLHVLASKPTPQSHTADF